MWPAVDAPPRTRANRWPVQVIMITLALARHLAVVDGYARRAQAAAQTLLGRCVAGTVRNISAPSPPSRPSAPAVPCSEGCADQQPSSAAGQSAPPQRGPGQPQGNQPDSAPPHAAARGKQEQDARAKQNVLVAPSSDLLALSSEHRASSASQNTFRINIPSRRAPGRGPSAGENHSQARWQPRRWRSS